MPTFRHLALASCSQAAPTTLEPEPPCPTSTTVQAATILVNTSPSLAERLQAGAQPVLGGDISLQLWPLMTGVGASCYGHD